MRTEEKPQVPPLRYAPVGMTILSGPLTSLFLTVFGTISLQKNCHPDRSVAQWRDLRFISSSHADSSVLGILAFSTK